MERKKGIRYIDQNTGKVLSSGRGEVPAVGDEVSIHRRMWIVRAVVRRSRWAYNEAMVDLKKRKHKGEWRFLEDEQG